MNPETDYVYRTLDELDDGGPEGIKSLAEAGKVVHVIDASRQDLRNGMASQVVYVIYPYGIHAVREAMLESARAQLVYLAGTLGLKVIDPNRS